MPGFEVRTKVLLTRSPLNFYIRRLDVIATSSTKVPFDLHALSTPPAFILSQNQTLLNNLVPEINLETENSLVN